ncbi:MAG: glycoside hydrolase family 15 protein [Candidatus Manganitrophus sp. SA1]|nr:glycoside hydrolase family 15 protein [Candidatus Manganitrophus morganii]
MEMLFRGTEAFGGPGMPPRWTRSEKEGIGTAYHTASRVWFTLSHGILNEVYFPTVDRPQIRDMEFLISDGESFFHEEKRDLATELSYLDDHSLGYRIVKSDPQGRYRIVKEVIADPYLPCVLIQTELQGEEEFLKRLHLYVLVAPHVEGRGWGNAAAKVKVAGRELLAAFRNQVYLALGATAPFIKSSCGYVGASDGWTDLHDNLRMDWEFDYARDGNVALMGELDLSKTRTFKVGLGFGFGLHGAATTLLQCLSNPHEEYRKRFQTQWERACRDILPLEKGSQDAGRLYHISHSLLMAHEDKTYPGAIIASMSIPWGEIHGDDDGLGGYHLVWTRDLCNSATGLLAAESIGTPLRALVYLAASQQPDGGFHQNFWIDGQPYWTGIQLDEVAFPILLAWHLEHRGALRDFDPYPMVLRAAHYLIRQGPATPQERWEENGGYSPSTLASNIAALICAAEFARKRGDSETARFLEEYADFLESHVEAWTVTTQGTLVPEIPRHFIRILPADCQDPYPCEDPNTGTLILHNQPPGGQFEFPAKEIVDAGFLELVRYGIRKAGDPLIEDSLRVVDAVLKVETPFGPCWRRYNHDGYGQRPDGGPYVGWGKGRAWPLLTGERAHYELAAGRDIGPYIKAIEGFASKGGMLPEQVWDEPDQPEWGMFKGRPTGSAMPLMWAHAEYIKLLRSARDGQVFDRIPVVAERYLGRKGRKDLEVWKFNRRIRSAKGGKTLRIQAPAPFRLRWTLDEWKTLRDTDAKGTGVGIYYVDIGVSKLQKAPIRFNFYWPEKNNWEGNDFYVEAQTV